MKSILVQLDDYTAKLLEQVAPGRSRKRSKFIRAAIIKALMIEMEEHTRRAYERQPDTEPIWFDPACWAPESEAIHPPKPLRGRARAPSRAAVVKQRRSHARTSTRTAARRKRR